MLCTPVAAQCTLCIPPSLTKQQSTYIACILIMCSLVAAHTLCSALFRFPALPFARNKRAGKRRGAIHKVRALVCYTFQLSHSLALPRSSSASLSLSCARALCLSRSFSFFHIVQDFWSHVSSFYLCVSPCLSLSLSTTK